MRILKRQPGSPSSYRGASEPVIRKLIPSSVRNRGYALRAGASACVSGDAQPIDIGGIFLPQAPVPTTGTGEDARTQNARQQVNHAQRIARTTAPARGLGGLLVFFLWLDLLLLLGN